MEVVWMVMAVGKAVGVAAKLATEGVATAVGTKAMVA